MADMAEPWESVEVDAESGVPTVLVKEDHLSNFPKFMHFIIKHEIGMNEGVFKVKLIEPWKSQSKLEDLLNFAHKFFTTKVKEGKKLKTPQFQIQKFFYGMTDEHLYGFKNKLEDRTTSERLVEQELLKTLTSPSSFSDQRTCCLDSMMISKENLTEHYWTTIRKSSSPSCGIFEKKCASISESEVNAARKKYCVSTEDDQPVPVPKEVPRDFKPSSEPIVYGPGIPVLGVDFPITPTFSLSKLGTVLDVHNEIVPGISYPYLYVGRKHASFPWHVEDVCCFSINYLHFGAPCVWFFVPPKYYSEFVRWSRFMPLDLGHISCNNILGHKYIIASEDFLKKLGIPVLTVIQEEKEIVITYPFAPHSGFKTAFSISEAANFGDPWWVDLAILAPTCECFDFQYRMNLSRLIEVCKPHLLDMYNGQDMLGLFNALAENKFIKQLELLPQKLGNNASVQKESEPVSGSDPCENLEEQDTEYKFKGARGPLDCPGCDKRLTGGRGKLQRMQHHINMVHDGDPELLKKLKEMNPAKPPGKTGSQCPICGEWRSGNKFHMNQHIKKKHAGKE